MERVPVLVVGGGSAGLSVSHDLTGLDIDHVVLERGRIGQTWRDRWDSFSLVTSNWSVRLPGGGCAGDDPDGCMPRDEIVANLAGYAASFVAPVQEGVAVQSLDRVAGGFVARTSAGGFRPDYRSLLSAADAFDDMRFPFQVDGETTVVDGMYFVGTHFLRTRKSSILLGVGEDAAIVARTIAGRISGAATH